MGNYFVSKTVSSKPLEMLDNFSSIALLKNFFQKIVSLTNLLFKILFPHLNFSLDMSLDAIF